MSDPAVRRLVVGVDGSAESASALRWACREASLRGAEVHAVHAWEASPTASYAVPAQGSSVDFDALWRSVLPDGGQDIQGVPVRTEVATGLAARVLLERCDGADMLVLGTAGKGPGASRPVGPVIRACLRRAPCPVVVISSSLEGLPRHGPGIPWAEVRVPAAAFG
jgi:nucleotide-binding universal stress UspA family protein